MIWRGLLVSGRDGGEAAEALAGGSAIIDVKEPLAGPLGAAAPARVAAIAAVVRLCAWAVVKAATCPVVSAITWPVDNAANCAVSNAAT